MSFRLLPTSSIDETIELLILGNFDTDTKYSLQIRGVDIDKFYIAQYLCCQEYPLNVSDNIATFQKNFYELFQDLKLSSIEIKLLEFWIKNDHNEAVKLETNDVFKSQVMYHDEYLTLKTGGGKTFALGAVWKHPSIDASSLVAEPDALSIKLYLSSKQERGKVIVRRRIAKKIVFFDYSTEILLKDDEAKIYFSQLTDNLSAKDMIFDFYFRYETEYGYILDMPIAYKGDVLELTSVPNFQLKFYTTKSGRLAVGIKEDIEKTVVTLDIQDKSSLGIDSDILFDEIIVYQKELRKPFPDMGNEVYINEIFRTTKGSIDFNEFKTAYYDTMYVVRLVIDNCEICPVTEKMEKIVLELEDNTVTIASSPEGIGFTISNSNKNAIPIVLLSSCVSRRMMTRKQNYDYKKIFNVVLEHFWPSMFSLTSEKIDIPEGWFSHWEEREQKPVSREFGKTLFDELSNIKFEYLVLDLFTDAIHGPRIMEGNKYIGYQGYARNIYSEYLTLDSERYYLQTNEYFEHWKKAADAFMEKLTQYIPSNRIILVNGGFSEMYWDEEGKKIPFKGSKLSGSNLTSEALAARGELWNRMNAYMVTRYPQLLVLETRQYEYSGHYADQSSIAPYHYEQNMYRSQLAELAKLVLWDKLNNK